LSQNFWIEAVAFLLNYTDLDNSVSFMLLAHKTGMIILALLD
jgi:hypothetical protein